MIRFNLVIQANEDEVRNVATVEIPDHHWDVVLCFEEPKGSLELGDLAEIPTRAAVRRLANVLWKMLDYAADSFPPAPEHRLPNGQKPSQSAAMHAAERVSALVLYLTEYAEATLDITAKSPVRR